MREEEEPGRTEETMGRGGQKGKRVNQKKA